MVIDPNAKATVPMLREVKLLHKFSEAELGQLIQLGTSAVYEAHTNVVIEGELTWGLYLMLEGVVGVFKNNKLTGELYDVGQLRQGNFFGEMSLIDENPRSATVRTLTECHVFFLSKDAFMNFLGQSSELKVRFYEGCIQDLAKRLRELDENYVVSQYQLWRTAMQKRNEVA